MTTLRNSPLFSTPSVVSPRNDGRFPFIQNFRKFGNSGKWYRNVPEKFSEIPETVEFPKCEPFNRKFQKSRKQSWMESKLPGKIFENLGIPREVVLFCGNFGECFATHIWKLPKIESGRFGWTESARRLRNEHSNCRSFWWRVTVQIWIAARDWLKQNFNQSEGRKLLLFLVIFYPPTDFAPHPTIWTPGKV